MIRGPLLKVSLAAVAIIGGCRETSRPLEPATPGASTQAGVGQARPPRNTATAPVERPRTVDEAALKELVNAFAADAAAARLKYAGTRWRGVAEIADLAPTELTLHMDQENTFVRGSTARPRGSRWAKIAATPSKARSRICKQPPFSASSVPYCF